MSSYSKKEKEEIVRELKEVLDDYENLARMLESQIEQNAKIKSVLSGFLNPKGEKAENPSDKEYLALQDFLFELDSQDAFDKLTLDEVSALLPICVAWIESDAEKDWDFKARGCAFLMAAMAKWKKELFEDNGGGNKDLFERLGTAFASKHKFAQLVSDKIISESELNYCISYFTNKDETLNEFSL